MKLPKVFTMSTYSDPLL